MKRLPRLAALAALTALATLPLQACSRASAGPAAPPSPRAEGPQGGPEGARTGGPGRPGRGAGRQEGPRAYDKVITDKAVTQTGMFTTHRIGDKLYFEIPAPELNREMLLLGRAVESTAQSESGFFGGGPRLIVQWERHGDRVILRQKRYDVVADSTTAIARRVEGFRKGPILASFNVEAYGSDSAAVVDVTSLFISNIPELAPLDGIQKSNSWIERVWAFPDNVDVEATQTGHSRPSGPGATPRPTRPGGSASRRPRTQTALMHFSLTRLPEHPMMPRLHDKRVGFNSFEFSDYGKPEHRTVKRRYIRRFRLEKKDPAAAVSEPVEPIVYWIDPATPEWLKPWVRKGIEAWQGAFEGAGFSHAIEGRYAPTPEEDPDFSLYDGRHSVIYWRASAVPNATGGQIWDPRSGEILKGEVNMYHNVMNLLRNWYFIQVSPLDPRAQHLPLPDSLMGRLVEYVVTHEVGHSIGFPHNMKASAMYPADSIRSASFLRRMGGHVATLMDYSRFNYVAQPEDHVPVDLLVPRVGPYDRFALHWGYAPIPGARTPDDERDTLDAWARQQDTIPWLRFTTSDSRNDPEALTEAVGDADAVKSTTLAMKNLQRVMDSMLRVAERPGEDYETLDELYGNAISQWGRYMGHVAALVGGAQTQERYGTGPRFKPVPKARQREAVRFLNRNAFATPEIFLDDDILFRIEADGAIARIRTAQSRVLNTLLSQRRLEDLIEYEALAARPGDTYSLTDLMADLRDGVWGELDDRNVRINVYRRNLQRAFLNTVDRRLHPTERDLNRPANPFNPPAAQPWSTDVRAVLRTELQDISAAARRALPRAADEMTRRHLRDVRMEIERILSPER